MRKKDKLRYSLVVDGYWWCGADKKWYSGKDPKTPWGTKNLSNMRNFKTKAAAVKACKSTPKDSSEILLMCFFYKKGKRMVKEWEWNHE